MKLINFKKRLTSKETKVEVIKTLNDSVKRKKDIIIIIQEKFIVPVKRISYAIRILSKEGHINKTGNLEDMRLKLYYLTNKGLEFYERLLL